MRRPDFFGKHDDEGLEPDVKRELAAIDAGLAGLEVHPDYAELASLAVAIRDEAPDVDAEFAAMLDERAAAGFPTHDPQTGRRVATARPWDWVAGLPMRRLVPAMGAVASLVVVIAISASVLNGSGGGSSSSEVVTSAGQAAKPKQAQGTPDIASGSSAAGAAAATASSADSIQSQQRPVLPGALTKHADNYSTVNGPEVFAKAPGRHVAQKASLVLSTDPDKVRGVAASVTQIVASHHGLVISSQITTGSGAPANGGGGGGPVPVPESPLPFSGGALGAEFQLRIPASQLSSALDDLSQLGLVVSRDQGTQDITGSFHSVHSRIQDLRSERDKLLAELPNAVSQDAIDAINHRLAVIHSQLSGAEGQLGHLQQRVAVVPVHVSVVAKGAGGSDSSFDLGQAAHDAGRVLVVGAGVALITLAVVVPLGLLVGLAWLAIAKTRQRRREKALD